MELSCHRITVYCVHILKDHKETYYSVKFCAQIKNISLTLAMGKINGDGSLSLSS
jgi:hypothetical protein